MHNSYDLIAPYYDRLSRLIFFRAQLRGQIEQLAFIPLGSKILIVGGGTGWILDEITKIYPSGLQITYMERSSKMLDLSRKRDVRGNQVSFIHASAEDFETDLHYDIVITAFLFDNFTEEMALKVFHRLDAVLKNTGLWLFSDFHNTSGSGMYWKKILLKMMYVFFKTIANVEATALVDTAHFFRDKSYRVIQVSTAYSGLIKSIIYRK